MGGRAVGHQPVRRVRGRRRASAEGSRQRLHGHRAVHRTRIRREALKHALAMGADEAVLVSDPALNELDTVGAARVLAAAIQKIGDADMVVFGRQTLDNGVRSHRRTDGTRPRVADAWVGRADQSRGRKRKRGTSHRRRPAIRQSQVARRAERRPKHRRAALPVVHGHPQSVEGEHPRLVIERPWHRRPRRDREAHRVDEPTRAAKQPSRSSPATAPPSHR